MSHKIVFDPISKIWTGPQVPYPYGNDSLGEVLYKVMLEDLEHICQISDDSGETYTNERMLKAAVSMANSLRMRGLKKGDTALVLMHNHHYLLPTWLGCVLAGVVLCPFHFTYSNIKSEFDDLIEQIDPKIMITSYLDSLNAFTSVFEQLKIECPIYMYENQTPGCHDLKPMLEEHFTSFEEFHPAGVTDPAKESVVLILSSGTTGKPKFINGTHKTMMMQFLEDYRKLNVTTAAVPGWQSEFIFMMGILAKTCCRIVRNGYTTEEFLLMLEKHKVQIIICNPIDIYKMIKSELIKKVDLSEMLIVMSTGHHLSVKLAAEFQEYIPNGVVYSAYGNSEFGGGITDASDLDPDVPSLVGKVKKNFRYCVIDEEGNRLGPNEVGELCIASGAPFGGFYKNEKMTKECTTPDGFFKGGDLGYLDEQGNVYLMERKKFNICYQGKNLSQWDVEKIVLENVEGVSGVCVVGIESQKYGMMPVIAVVPEKGGDTLSEADIIKTVMEHHPFEFETRVFFFDKFPVTIAGKYKKFLIKEMIIKRLTE